MKHGSDIDALRNEHDSKVEDSTIPRRFYLSIYLDTSWILDFGMIFHWFSIDFLKSTGLIDSWRFSEKHRFLFRLSPHAAWHDQLLQSASFVASSALPAFESLVFSHQLGMHKVSQPFNLHCTFNLWICFAILLILLEHMLTCFRVPLDLILQVQISLLFLAQELHCFTETGPVQHRLWPQLRAEPQEDKNQH